MEENKCKPTTNSVQRGLDVRLRLSNLKSAKSKNIDDYNKNNSNVNKILLDSSNIKVRSVDSNKREDIAPIRENILNAKTMGHIGENHEIKKEYLDVVKTKISSSLDDFDEDVVDLLNKYRGKIGKVVSNTSDKN